MDIKAVVSCQMIMNYERVLSWPRRAGNRQIGPLEGKRLDFGHPGFEPHRTRDPVPFQTRSGTDNRTKH